jgi:hypothetical protein
MSLYELNEEPGANPIDLLEGIIAGHEWPFERHGEDEISVAVAGSWCDYTLGFLWRDDADALALSAAFDFRVAKERRAEVCQLLALLNERLWIGHFDLTSGESSILYRTALPLPGGARATQAQCEAMIQSALEACERYYPSFQFVLWGGKSAEDAIEASILECQGEA